MIKLVIKNLALLVKPLQSKDLEMSDIGLENSLKKMAAKLLKLLKEMLLFLKPVAWTLNMLRPI